MILWINDNMILGPKDLVMKVKANSMKQFKCNDCGHLEECIENKIKYVKGGTFQCVQMVLLQSFSYEFKLGKKCYNTPAVPGTFSNEASKEWKVSWQ
jgi:hypothetical protein